MRSILAQLRTDKYLIPIAFFCIYFIWGSTYLATKWAFVSFPPFAMTGVRLLLAGLIMLVFTQQHLRKTPNKQIKNAAVIGMLILGVGAGGSMWAVQFLDTGLASLIVGGEPLVLTLLTWAIIGIRPSAYKWVGLLLGSVGMYLLVSQDSLQGNVEAVWGVLALFLAIVSWAFGAIYINKWKMPDSKPFSAAIQMMSGGGLLLLISLLTQEDCSMIGQRFTWLAFFSWLYLLLFGSIIAYSAFNYLLLKVDPRKVATCGYVNPIIALLLGWYFNHEIISTQSLSAAAILILGVFFINRD